MSTTSQHSESQFMIKATSLTLKDIPWMMLESLQCAQEGPDVSGAIPPRRLLNLETFNGGQLQAMANTKGVGNSANGVVMVRSIYT